jgi:hypothetical protein
MNVQRLATLSLGAVALLLQACNTTNSPFFTPPQTLYSSSRTTSGAVSLFQLPLTSSSASTGALASVAGFPTGMCASSSGLLVEAASGPAEFQVWSAPASGVGPSFNVALGIGPNPRDCAFDGAGNLYVVDEQGFILVYPSFHQGSSAGTPIGSGINTPVGVTTDPSGNVFVSNNHTITEYGPLAGGNTLLLTINGNGGQGIKFGPDGNLYVADFTTGGKVDVFVPPFTNTSTFDHQISPPGATAVGSLAFDRVANLYVTGVNGSLAGKGIYVYAPPYTGAPVELDTALAGGIAIR